MATKVTPRLNEVPEADPHSIIVMAREHIGDLVCTTPALRALRLKFPVAHIAIEVGERAACVLDRNPDIDEVILRPRHQGILGKAAWVRTLRRRKFDLAVILDDSPDMILSSWLGGVSRRVGLVRRPRFATLLSVQVAFRTDAHEMVDNFSRVVEALGADATDRATRIFPSAIDIALVDRLFAESGLAAGSAPIAFNVSASTGPKQWPEEHFAALGNLLAGRDIGPLLLLGGPMDRKRAETIAAGLCAPPRIWLDTTPLQQAEIQRRCRLLVTADTGPMHLACATETPVIALFGPTCPLRYGPWYVPGNRIVRRVEGCPDCTWEACRNQNACMRAITPEEVAVEIRELLESVA